MATTKTAKIYKVKATHRTHETIYEGTMEYMLTQVFGYSLECGHSWNNKIPLEPKSGAALVKALNMSAEECHRYSDYYELLN